MKRGWLTLFRWRGSPVRVHWSFPLGAWMLSGFRFEPYLLLASALVVLVHEFGHALVVRATGHRVVSIDVHGLGGLCHWSGTPTPIQRAAIAWGGVWAQCVLLAATLIYFNATGEPTTRVALAFEYALVSGNAFLMAINLMPIAPLDGAEAWALPGLLFRRVRKTIRERRFQNAIKARRSAVKIVAPSGRNDAAASEAVREELARIDRVEKHVQAVRPEVDALLSRIDGLGRVDDRARRHVRAGEKAELIAREIDRGVSRMAAQWYSAWVAFRRRATARRA